MLVNSMLLSIFTSPEGLKLYDFSKLRKKCHHQKVILCNNLIFFLNSLKSKKILLELINYTSAIKILDIYCNIRNS